MRNFVEYPLTINEILAVLAGALVDATRQAGIGSIQPLCLRTAMTVLQDWARQHDIEAIGLDGQPLRRAADE